MWPHNVSFDEKIMFCVCFEGEGYLLTFYKC